MSEVATTPAINVNKPIAAYEAANAALCALVIDNANAREVTRCSKCYGRGHLGRTIVNVHDESRPTGIVLCRCMKKLIAPKQLAEKMRDFNIIESSVPATAGGKLLTYEEIAERKLQSGIAYGLTF